MDNVFDFFGLLWLLKLIWGFAFPPFLVVWFLKCLCKFFTIIELLEENVPFFHFFEYVLPVFALFGFLLHIFWRIVAPSCSVSFYMSLRISWVLLYDLLANPVPGPEGWCEVFAQLSFLIFLMLSSGSSDKQPLSQADIAFIKDFAGCDCSSQRNHIHSEEKESNSIWAFESQVKEGLLDVLPAFHLLQSGVGFDDLPQHCKMKVLNFLQKEIKDGKRRFEYRSSPVCESCSSSQGTSGVNKQQIVSESRIKHQEFGEISVQVLEVTHQVQESYFDTSFDSSDCCDCDSTDFENEFEAPEKAVLPSTVVNTKSCSTNESVQPPVPEANDDNELENLAKTVTTFELEPDNQSSYSKDMFANFKFKKSTMTNHNETEDVLNLSTNLELSDLLEDERAIGYQTGEVEKSGRKKRVNDRGGERMCGRSNCLEKGSQLCSRCKSISYCSVACSEMFWAEHKADCSKEKEKKVLRKKKKEKIASEVD